MELKSWTLLKVGVEGCCQGSVCLTAETLFLSRRTGVVSNPRFTLFYFRHRTIETGNKLTKSAVVIRLLEYFKIILFLVALAGNFDIRQV